MDIIVVQTNARIQRMSKRRQKIALRKRPQNVFTNVYPIAPPEMISDINGIVTFDVTFSYKPQVVEMSDYEMGRLDRKEGIPLEGADWNENDPADAEYLRGWKEEDVAAAQ